MPDKPIIMSAPMMCALLEGRKTQTRRVLKPQPYDVTHPDDGHRCWNASGVVGGRICNGDRHLLDLHREPHVGDRLWVREAIWQCETGKEVFYRADGDDYSDNHTVRARPSIHMPRWASRLTLIVTDVRVERVQDISEEDARAEGVEHSQLCGPDEEELGPYEWIPSFQYLWDSLHKPGQQWCDNPWCSAISFRCISKNIDELREAA